MRTRAYSVNSMLHLSMLKNCNRICRLYSSVPLVEYATRAELIQIAGRDFQFDNTKGPELAPSRRKVQ